MPFSRRDLLLAGLAAPAYAGAWHSSTKPLKPILKPKALRLGDTLAMVTPASGVDKPADLDEARKNLESAGFTVKVGAHAADTWGYLGGTDQHRADDLNAAFADPEVNGIIAFQGGYGCGRCVDLLDYQSFRDHPKVVIGFSDITGLLLALYAKAGVVTFYGPMAGSSFHGYEGENFRKVVREADPAGLLIPPDQPTGNPPNPGAATLKPGKATGKLVGGNLSLVASLVGSPYLPDLDDHLLFIEDVGEDPYRVDRMLNTLRISNSMQRVRGMVFGDFRPRGKQPDQTQQDSSKGFTMVQVFQNFADQMGIPAYCGAWFGHIRDKYTLPIGVQATMDADKQALTLLEPAVQ